MGMGSLQDYLEDLQRHRGMSLRCLARESGVIAATLSRWREGKQVPSPNSCKLLAEYLSVPVEHVLAMAGHLRPLHKEDPDRLPEFREYARQKYPEDLDDDMIAMVEDLIQRRRKRREHGS